MLDCQSAVHLLCPSCTCLLAWAIILGVSQAAWQLKGILELFSGFQAAMESGSDSIRVIRDFALDRDKEKGSVVDLNA